MKVITNARIYTLDPDQPLAEALLVDGGRIRAIGTEGDILGAARPGADRYDAGGRAVIPGLVDAHLHLEHYALGLQRVDCETDTRAACLQRVKDKSQTVGIGEWILGHGWNQNIWPEGFGKATDLDAAAPGCLAYLTAKSLHAAWASSAALRLAGIDRQTPDPPGGQIQRDERGEPTGILFETAMELVADRLPAIDEEQVAQAIQRAQPGLWRVGLTGVHDFDRKRCFAALQLLQARGDLRLRVVKSLPLDDLPYAAALGLRTGFGNDFLRIGSVKAFADGALGPQTAAMLQPYEGSADNRGMLMLDAEDLFEHGRVAVEAGLSLAVHAIGDQANHEVLNGYAQLREFERSLSSQKGLPPSKLRHRIEHVQLLHPDDSPRLAQLDLIASMQPIHATSDMLMADRFWGSRASESYAWRTQLQQGAVLAFGSDAPVESPNPFWGLHAAVTRRRLDGSPGEQGWRPEQKLAISEALQAYTTGPAYAAGVENHLGRLAPGFLADLLVLNQDPFTCAPEELHALFPVATLVDGAWVWQSIG